MNWLINIYIDEQLLELTRDNKVFRSWRIASAKNGPGEISGSECTPRGAHYIRAKIGQGAEENAVFIGRRATGEIYQPPLRIQHPQRDWILTRIMWLCGLEPGRNRGGNVDTLRRYVYIHGCPDEDVMGIPSSHGCIKMRNAEILELFDLIPAGTRVHIFETRPEIA